MRTWPWERNNLLGVNNTCFKVGTCEGMFSEEARTISLIAIANLSPRNGDFARAMDALEQRAKKKGKALRVVEIWNPRLRRHLVEKRGYRDCGEYVERSK